MYLSRHGQSEWFESQSTLAAVVPYKNVGYLARRSSPTAQLEHGKADDDQRASQPDCLHELSSSNDQ
jgi:hypothetical protein